MTKEEIVKICKKYNIENYTINDNMTIDVDGDVDLSFQKLTNLPLKFNKITGDFSCSFNNLTSLHDLPINFHIGGDFWGAQNKITEAKEFGKLFFGHIGKNIYLDVRFGVLEKFLNKNKNPPKKDLPRLLSELRKIPL